MSRRAREPPEIPQIIQKIVAELEQSHGVKLDPGARRRVEEGFLHTIRAVYFLSILDRNHHRFRPRVLAYFPRLRGRWERVTPENVGSARAVLQERTGLLKEAEHQEIASRLEQEYGLSRYVAQALNGTDVERSVVELVIEIESDFISALREQPIGQRRFRLLSEGGYTHSVEEVKRTEGREKKWFG